MFAAARPTNSAAGLALRPVRLALALVPALTLLAACGGTGGATAQPTVTVTASGGSGNSTGGTSGGTPPAATSPGIVAVTTAGALVKLDASTGNVTQTLVSGGVLGDEISVSPDGSVVYFAAASGCDMQVESIGIGGGTPTPIAPGDLPAVSPDGSKLAFAQQPLLTQSCIPDQSNIAGDFKVVIRTLSSGAQQVLPAPPQVQHSGLFLPISHLSWAADSVRLAVSTSAVQDNEGWALYVIDTSSARYYAVPGAGATTVPVTGAPEAQRSYIREGVFLPDGNLFISRACCGGVPIHNTSRLMWVVAPSGAFVRQVALGYPSLDHVSLAVSASGQWLLYLADHDLYVSEHGNRPSRLTAGLVAAAWG